uniref:(northern house mosquito) hypothetical protein n=1 Tax=Culex pipiens TaxID=7175 RepID=A0A8D8AZN1_CULPI
MEPSLYPALEINMIAGPSTLHRSQQLLYPGGHAAEVTEYMKDLDKAEAVDRNSHTLLHETQTADVIFKEIATAMTMLASKSKRSIKECTAATPPSPPTASTEHTSREAMY